MSLLCIFCNRGPLYCKQSKTIQNLVTYCNSANMDWFQYFISFFVVSTHSAGAIYFHPMCYPCKKCNLARIMQIDFDSACNQRALVEFHASEKMQQNQDFEYYDLFDIKNVFVYTLKSKLQFTSCHTATRSDLNEYVPIEAFGFKGLYLLIRNPIDGIVSQFELFAKCNQCGTPNVFLFVMERTEEIFYITMDGTSSRFHLVDYSQSEMHSFCNASHSNPMTNHYIEVKPSKIMQSDCDLDLYESI